MSLAIIYGSTTGNTEDLAYQIAKEFGPAAKVIKSVDRIKAREMRRHKYLVFGIPTWNHGELQHEWAERIGDVEKTSFKGRKVAFFGSGDAKKYPEHFQDAIGLLWKKFEAQGAELVGRWSTEGYDFEHSEGLTEEGDSFVGLAIDKNDPPEKVEEQIRAWVEQLRSEFGIS